MVDVVTIIKIILNKFRNENRQLNVYLPDYY
jgi:hypothetical protein